MCRASKQIKTNKKKDGETQESVGTKNSKIHPVNQQLDHCTLKTRYESLLLVGFFNKESETGQQVPVRPPCQAILYFWLSQLELVMAY